MYKSYMIAAAGLLLAVNTAVASPRDSIGVENYKGKKLIIHKVKAKDTYYSIARRYNVNPKDVMNFNDSKYLQIGVIIKVPTSAPFDDKEKTAGTPPPTDIDQPGKSEEGFIMHTVQKKENLNMLAERYGTTVNEIKKLNNLRSINLQIDQVLRIPLKADQNKTPENSADSTTDKVSKQNTLIKDIDLDSKKPEEEFIVHTVASNETIYSIASKYKMTIDQLKSKNNLSNSSLFVGQRLLIKGQYPVKPEPEPLSHADSVHSIKDPSLKYPASSYGLNRVDDKGTAVWIEDPDLDPSKMLILHRTAAIGTVMKITNPMTNRSALAKVVGKFTENESTKDVIIVMTKAVADALGALDKRFFCNITYGGQEHEEE